MSHPSRYFDRDGNPITLEQYATLSEDENYRILVRDEAAGLRVCTAWLGVNQGPFSDDERTLIFGTAILDPTTRDLWNGYEMFSATEDEARARHQSAVELAATRTIAAGVG